MSNLRERLKGADSVPFRGRWKEIEQRAARIQRRSRWARAATMVAAVVIAVAGVGFVGLAFFRSPTSPAIEGPPKPAALGSSGVPGWHFRVLYLNGSEGPVLQATNYGLPDRGKDFYSATARGIPTDGIAIQVQEFTGICGCVGFEDIGDAIHLTAADVEPWDAGSNTDFGRPLLFHGQYLSVFARFGHAADPTALASANAALATVSVASKFALTPSGAPETAPPVFPTESGWITAVSGGAHSNPATAWASTTPLDGRDLHEGANDGTLPYPNDTLQNMGSTDVVLVADWWKAADCRATSTSLQEPLSLSDAQIQNQWEGQVADNIPLYLIFGSLDGNCVDVRAFFGTQHPSSDTLAKAQTELDGLRFPFDSSHTTSTNSSVAQAGNGLIAFGRGTGIYTVSPDGSGLTLIRDPSLAVAYHHPEWSPDGSKIAFDGYPQGGGSGYGGGADYDIYTMNADGSALRNLTTSPGDVKSGFSQMGPVWSPDGTKIAYNGDDGLYVMNADGSDQTEVASGGGNPSWSPDGTRIAFQGRGGIWSVAPDGSGLLQLASGQDGSPAYSPDGTKIAYKRCCSDEAIYVMNADGSQQTRVANFQADTIGTPVWSPDGTEIAFDLIVDPVHGTWDIYAANADGSGATDLTPTQNRDENTPVWSPDGTKIAFEASTVVAGETDNTGTFDIYVMNRDGTRESRLTNDVHAGGFDLSWQSR